jgi:hypothetical protein
VNGDGYGYEYRYDDVDEYSYITIDMRCPNPMINCSSTPLYWPKLVILTGDRDDMRCCSFARRPNQPQDTGTGFADEVSTAAA